MKQTFIKPKDVDRDIFLDNIELELSAKLKATKNNDQVDGYTRTYEKDGFLYVDVYLYDQNELPDYEEGFYNNRPWNKGHKTEFRKINGNIKGLLDKAYDKLSERRVV